MKATTARQWRLWAAWALLVACKGGGPKGDLPPEETWAVMPQAPALSVQLNADFNPVGATKLAEVYSVDVQVSALGLDVPNEVEMIFRAPSGAIFERRKESFAGSPFDTQQKTLSLAVAGTLVETDTVSGLWTGQLLVNGVEAATTQFELLP